LSPPPTSRLLHRFDIMQVFRSHLMGMHRQIVSPAGTNLQKAGLIRYSRRKLKVLNRQSLEEASCDCNGAFQREFEDLSA
jgi:hypothetical protein